MEKDDTRELSLSYEPQIFIITNSAAPFVARQIPVVSLEICIARRSYILSCRNPDPFTYSHHGLDAFERVVDQVLVELHLGRRREHADHGRACKMRIESAK